MGAIVYGVYSLFEKLNNGIILYLLMNSSQFANKDEFFIRIGFAVIPGFFCFMAWFLAMIGSAKDY